MLALAWLLAIIGAIVAYIISLAGAMRTVPQLPWSEAIVGVPLPLIAGALALWRLFGPTNPPNQRPWIAAGGALVLALLGLLIIAVSYFEQPGG